MTRVDERTVVERFSWRLHSHWIPRGTLRVDLITGLNELRAWIGDDHWWRNGSHAGWLALVADLRGAIAETGIPLRQTLGATLNTLDTRLDVFGDALRQDKKLQRSRAAFNPSVCAALDRHERLLRETLAKPVCVQAAWAGLWEAGRDGAADGVLDQLEVELWRVADHAGHPWDRLVRLVGGVLADSARFIDEARRDVTTGEIGLLQRAHRAPRGIPASAHGPAILQHGRPGRQPEISPAPRVAQRAVMAYDNIPANRSLLASVPVVECQSFVSGNAT